MMEKMVKNPHEGELTLWGHAVPCLGFLLQNVTSIQVILETIKAERITNLHQGAEVKSLAQGHIQFSWFPV